MSKRVKSRWGVLAALAVAFVAVLAVVIGAVRPALAAGETMGHLASGANNGNAHFGGAKPEAFVLSDDTVGDESVGADFILNSDASASRLRFVIKYVDDNNWAYVGYDTGSNWFLEYKVDGSGSYPTISGLPSVPKGEKATISVSHEGNNITVDVNGTTSTIENAAVAGLMAKDGKVGFGGATYSTQYTDIYFTNVKMGGTTVTDFSDWAVYQEIDGQTWEPAAEYVVEVPEGRKWIQITGGSHNGGGHAYGNANTSAPLVLVDNSRKANNGDTLSLTLVPESDTINFGIFYTYVDDSNWMYVGYDPSSKWYCQYNYNGSGSYPAFGGDLPTPEKGVPMEISISVNNEKVSLTVNGVTQSMSNQAAGTCTASLSGKGVYGVKANGTSSVRFADAAVNGTSIMEEDWALLVTRGGETVNSWYVNLADVSGTVTDENGDPIEGATVRIGAANTKTNAEGNWTIADVEVGEQEIVASMPGYIAQTITYDVKGASEGTNEGVDFQLEPKPALDLAKYETIASDEMTAYVSADFPQVARYAMAGENATEKFVRGQESDVTTLAVNGVEVTPEVTSEISGDTATYTMAIKDDGASLDFTMTVEVKVEGTVLSWEVTDIQKNEGCGIIKSISIANNNLVTVDQADAGADFAGANMSTNTTASGDRYYTFDEGFEPNKTDGFMYGFLSTDNYSAGIFSNSEAEGDKRITLNNGTDTMGMTSSVWYYEQGDKAAQNYVNSHSGTTYPTSELPWVKVAIADDVNGDGTVDWNDGAIVTRDILNVPQGSEDMKDIVAYRIVMNFGSEVTNPYAQTADNLKKVSLITDGLPQALLLKGYGNEGHDSANSEYADVAEKEGGIEGFRELIKIAHEYDTEIGIHINAQESYPESKSFNDRMVQGMGNGWGWLDQSQVIDKLWDLSSGARWARLVQLYDRINDTDFLNKDWEKGEYVGNPAETGAVADSEETVAADAANRPDNMDFIYLDVWYQDAWETRNVARQINALGWRFSTEFPNEGEYDSTWSHWATEISYGGTATKGINSDIVRFLRNSQRDISPNNGPSKGGVMDNPLLGGYVTEGFEGWGNEQDFNTYIETLYLENLPTRFLMHYDVTDWENYAEGESPVGNHEKQITLKNAEGDTVVVTRHEDQRGDTVIEREITLNGAKVLDDDSYLLPWTTDEGEEKLYLYSLDGGSVTLDVIEDWRGKSVTLYKLTDQGRVDGKNMTLDETLTYECEAGVPYVIVASGSTAPTADTVDFGEGTGVVDPGFNAYTEGEKLNSEVWSGDIDNDAIEVEVANTGDQRLAINSPSEDVAVSTTLSGLTAGKTYVAELYIENSSDATATVEVTSGDESASRSTGRSVIKNYTASDQRHTSSLQQSYMTRIYVKFTAGEETATLTIKRAAGEGSTYVDNIRYVANAYFPVQAEDGSFYQDFENAVSGLYPFVIGPTANGGDAVTHLSEDNGKYTSVGWNGKVIDDALDGNWSLKHHDSRQGLLFQTTPQTLYFEPGVTYTVEFDYQVGPYGSYAMKVGDGENTYVDNAFNRLEATYDSSTGTQTTKHFTMEVTGAQDGLTWIGIHSQGTGGNTAIGSGDLVIDNLRVTPKNAEPEPGEPTLESIAVKTAPDKTEYTVGEKLDATGLVLTLTYSDDSTKDVAYADAADEITLDPTTLTEAGEQTVTVTYESKATTFKVTVIEAEEPEPTTYTVTFVGAQGVEDQTVEEGKTATEPKVTTPAGYTFGGWLLNGEKYDFSKPVTSDITLTASWILNEPTVSVGSDNPVPVEGETVTLTATAEHPGTGVTLTYTWAKDGTTIDGETGSTLAVTEDGTYTVTVTATDPSELTASATAETTVEFAAKPDPTPGVNYDALKDVIDEAKALKADDYTAETWSVLVEKLAAAQEALSAENQETVDAAASALRGAIDALKPVETPTPDPETHTVTFVVGFDFDDITDEVEDGETAEAPVVPTKDGWKFVGWYTQLNEDGSVEGEYDFSTPVTDDLTLYGGWIELTDEPSDPDKPGTTEPDPTPVKPGADGTTGGSTSGGNLAQTGDPTSMVAALATALAGVGALVASRKRR